MIESEVLMEASITNAAMPQRDHQISTQLNCMPVLLLEGSAQQLLEHAGDGEGLQSWRRLVAENEPAAAGREYPCCSDHLERVSLDDFEAKIWRYERVSHDALSDMVKIAVVQMGLEDEDLRRHVLMLAAPLIIFLLVREEARSITIARDMRCPVPCQWTSDLRTWARIKQMQRDGQEGQGRREVGRDGHGEGACHQPRRRSDLILVSSQETIESGRWRATRQSHEARGRQLSRLLEG